MEVEQYKPIMLVSVPENWAGGHDANGCISGPQTWPNAHDVDERSGEVVVVVFVVIIMLATIRCI